MSPKGECCSVWKMQLICWMLSLATHFHTHHHLHPFHFVLFKSKIWLLSNIQQTMMVRCMMHSIVNMQCSIYTVTICFLLDVSSLGTHCSIIEWRSQAGAHWGTSFPGLQSQLTPHAPACRDCAPSVQVCLSIILPLVLLSITNNQAAT